MITLNETDHTYEVDGEIVPSVTTILRFLHADAFRNINPSVLDFAAARGTAVHEACEMIDYDALDEIVPGIEGYLKAYNTFLRDYRPVWIGIERAMAHIRPDASYAGTIDRYGKIDGRHVIVDLKTSTPSRSTYISLCAQTAAYAGLLGDMNGEIYDRYGLFLKPDGDYRLVDCREKEAQLGIKGLDTFATCFALHRQFEQKKEKKSAES